MNIAELLQDPNATEISISTRIGNIDSALTIDKKGKTRRIVGDGTTLEYSIQKYNENPTEYVSAQLESHRTYRERLDEVLRDEYKDAGEDIEKESEVERALQFLPENATRLSIEIAKLVVAPLMWIKGKRLRTVFEEIIDDNKNEKTMYQIFKSTIEYGQEFIQSRISECSSEDEALIRDLREWANVQKDIIAIYSGLVSAAERKMQTIQRMYLKLFPDSK